MRLHFEKSIPEPAQILFVRPRDDVDVPGCSDVAVMGDCDATNHDKRDGPLDQRRKDCGHVRGGRRLLLTLSFPGVSSSAAHA
jgi:hypothetical protein